MMFTKTSRVGLLAAAQLLQIAASNAQTWNDSSVQGCQGPISVIVSGNHPFNSTGMVRLAPDAVRNKPWYISLTITDRRDPHYIYGDSASWQEREGFLSVPSSLAGSDDGNQTEWCMYMLPAQDAGSQEEDGDCGGILSDDCISALRDNTPPMSDGECYRPDNLEEACGTSERRKLNYPNNFSSSNCTLTGLPHIDLPDGYRTYGNLPVGTFEGGDDRDNFDLYDRHVRQAVPMVLTVKATDGTIANKVICLAPNNVVEGSRDPEESAATRLSFVATHGAAIAVAVLVSMMAIA